MIPAHQDLIQANELEKRFERRGRLEWVGASFGSEVFVSIVLFILLVIPASEVACPSRHFEQLVVVE